MVEPEISIAFGPDQYGEIIDVLDTRGNVSRRSIHNFLEPNDILERSDIVNVHDNIILIDENNTREDLLSLMLQLDFAIFAVYDNIDVFDVVNDVSGNSPLKKGKLFSVVIIRPIKQEMNNRLISFGIDIHGSVSLVHIINGKNLSIDDLNRIDHLDFSRTYDVSSWVPILLDPESQSFLRENLKSSKYKNYYWWKHGIISYQVLIDLSREIIANFSVVELKRRRYFTPTPFIRDITIGYPEGIIGGQETGVLVGVGSRIRDYEILAFELLPSYLFQLRNLTFEGRYVYTAAYMDLTVPTIVDGVSSDMYFINNPRVSVDNP